MNKHMTIYWLEGHDPIIHFMEFGERKALCEYKPKIGTARVTITHGFATDEVECPKCATRAAVLIVEEANKLVDKANALAMIGAMS